MSDTILSAIQSPFQRLRELLGHEKPGAPPIDMTIGEPRHGVPRFAAEIIANHWRSFGRYPPIGGILELRRAIADWLVRRYGIEPGLLDAERAILPLCGTREGLVSALSIAVALKGKSRAAVLMPNPFYQAYYAAALTAGCEPVLLSATAGVSSAVRATRRLTGCTRIPARDAAWAHCSGRQNGPHRDTGDGRGPPPGEGGQR